MLVRARVNELHIDLQSITREQHAALHDRRHVELLADRPHVLGRFRVLEHGRARDDPHVAELRELRQQRIVHARREELGVLIGRCAQVRERQHGNRAVPLGLRQHVIVDDDETEREHE